MAGSLATLSTFKGGNAKDIEDIGADNVADGDVILLAHSRDDRGCQLWQTGADRDNGQTDESL